MKKLFFSFGIVCVSLLMSSCGASKKLVSPASLNGEWNIVEVEGQNIASSNHQPAPFIGFDFVEKRIYGNSGCNRMMGTFVADTLKPGVISFGTIAGTRMACPDMTLEKSVLGALGKVKAYEVISCDKEKDASCKVALCDEAGNKVVIIEKKAEEKSPAADLTVLNGEWLIKTVDGGAVPQAEKTPFLGFNVEEGRVYGTAGCNSLNGALKQDAEKPKSVTLGPIAATMMMCKDMEAERVIFNALDSVRSFDVMADGSVAFYNADGKEVLTLVKK